MQISIPIPYRRPSFRVPRKMANWLLCWILLPNLPFFAMYLVGSPSRQSEIMTTGLIGLLVSRSSLPVKYIGFLVGLTYSIACFISSLFNLSLYSLYHSIKFLFELKLSASVEYVALGLLVAATLVAGWKMLRLPSDLEKASHLAGALAATLSFAAFDGWMSHGTRDHYQRLAPNGAPFVSATSQTGIGKLERSNNNLLVVVVEALGLPKEPALQQKLLARWRRSDIAAGYDVTTGSTTFYGSTTSAEVRELCGRWGDYRDYREQPGRECLPAKLASRGYQTTAIHPFDGSMFDRTQWYPQVGFQRLMFREELVDRGARMCSGVFPGACDPDVSAIVSEQLKRPGKPQFVYWLTVNSHLPVAPDESLRTLDCKRFDRALAEDHPMTCRLFSLWNQLDESLARILTDPNLPATDVLIVGDHAPPFFDRNERIMFHGDRVPWILLKHRKGAPALAEAGSGPKAVRPQPHR